ncbi:NAD(P)H-dependent oxidoreductase [Desmospora activa]|uniref:Putative homoserine dehydrogenase-like protein n=1 Tax=Desmospora activa DSM 45169 TaxID=1121389 RepID=A0A2T4Z0L6_9BACL|nr:NAD(P)-dependent oxidoreductase [Desmospora activa]PTM53281.1 putative homoserine dehydrogenase-like protein [Desmospora activa DSM 45169]
MLGLNRRLKDLQKQGARIRVGLVGAGQMGRGMIAQIAGMAGMDVVATADLMPENARNAYLHAKVSASAILETQDEGKADRAIRSGRVVVTSDAGMIPRLEEVDVVVDATGHPNVGAMVAWNAIMQKKHIVMLNVEADVTIGPYLKKVADAAGVVYTGSAGDEPGALMELHDFAEALSFEVIALGKGKNNPLDRSANPDSCAEEARRKKANPKMLASFKDGTKTMVEMNAVSNATGFLPDVAGMHGPSGQVKDLPSLFRLREEGGILNGMKIVDYVNGVAPGVFAVITTELDEIHEEMKYLSMGEGPHYVLYRPYHLTSLETPISIARAYLDRESTIAPHYGNRSETVAVAKKALKLGEALDGLGGFTAYGRLVTAQAQKESQALPIGLISPDVVMKRHVPQGEIITYDDIEFREKREIVKIRELMDALL